MNFIKENKIEILLTVVTLIIVSLYGINNFSILKDHGLYSYSGQGILEGETPYSMAIKMKGPMNFFTQAFFMSLFSFLPQYLAIRVGMLGLISIFVILFYKILLRITNDKILSTASSLILISFTFFMEVSLLGDPKLTALLFILLSLNFLFKRKYVFSGFFISLAFLSYQPTAIVILAPLFFLFLNREKIKITVKKFGSVILGFAIPCLVILLYFFFTNSIKDFIEISFLLPIKVRSVSTFINMTTVFNTLAYYCTEIIFLLLAMIGFIYVIYSFIKNTKKEGFGFIHKNKELATFSIVFILIGLYIFRDYQSGADLTFFLPVISVSAAFTLKKLLSNIKGISKKSSLILIILISIYGFFPVLQPVYPENKIIREAKELKVGGIGPNKMFSEIIDKYGLTKSLSIFLFNRKGEEITIHHQLKLSEYIKDNTKDNEKILSFGAPEILFLAERKNLNRYPHLTIRKGWDKRSLKTHGHTLHLMETIGFDKFKEDITSSNPKFIITRNNTDETIDELNLREFVNLKYKIKKIIKPKEYILYEKI